MQENKMAVMPVRRLLLNMAWPMMLSMLIQALYNLVDSMFVAQLSSDGFVALALVYPIQTLMIAVCVGTGVGFNALLARRLGEGRPDEANRVVANGYFVYLVCWVVFLVLGVGLAPVFMGLFAPGQPQVIDYGIQYLSIVTGASVGICMQFAGERTLQATGNTVGPMVIQGIGAVINLILDPLLIFGIGPFPRMEVAGAALATVLGQVVGMVVGLCMVRRSSIVRLSFRGFRPDSAIIRTMFRVGVPAILVQALATVMNLGMNLILPLFTASGVFILGAYFKLQSFLFMPVNGLNNALIPIVSFNYGARQRSRITGVIHFALVLSAAIMAVGTVVFLAIPGPLLRLFDADAAVLAEGISALRLIALSFVCAGVSVILCAALQALGAANSSLVVSLLRQLVLLFPLALLLGALRPSLVWLAFLLSEGAACLTALLLYRRTARGRLAGMEE
ncbi:MATE family efflux transporter [Flavonifractor plautii]|uniref:MATE family efflux transporter n=1 Tax=Flavonifractor plautii TaxID=292800 RepID=UPI0006C7D0B6|nr:MATE family efflux transporter [Flavonifractor plautii]MBM6791372.1 MATE family efflux transporter [Flavonifractor plautii]MDB7920296.1 MATE family efflux transporter [Flavonifractor plautii]MDB7944077.1 MATE family efflux transporter [Flavonifractor plautii]MDU3012985.1 MATE family efflux transporter [Flavonifractor plautii]